MSLFEKSSEGKRYGRTEYGGARTKGFRKLERPLSTKKWIHLVLKSEKAVGQLSFLNLRNKAKVESLLKVKAKKFGVLIAEMVNVGNHFHLKIRITNRESFVQYLRSVTSYSKVCHWSEERQTIWKILAGTGLHSRFEYGS